MNHETETPEEEAPDRHANHRHRITLLTGIYLEAGLPLDLAVQSAAADHELFKEEMACA